MDIFPSPSSVSETSAYQKLLVPLRSSKQTPEKDVVMVSASPKNVTPTNRPVFSNDDFIPFSLDDDTRSNKKRRERGEEEPSKPAVNPYSVRPVWVDPSVDVAKLSLGDELSYFCQWISLTEEENSLREHAVVLIRDIVKSLFPAARVEVFGSHYTKIALPSSDVDLMVYNVTTEEPLTKICNEINQKYADQFVLIKLIAHAKIPVLKLTTKLGEVKLDMCMAISDEPPNSVKIAQYLSKMPVLRPLVVVLKQFLQQFLLNDTYTGGAGSYLLTLMSISLLQFRENPRSPAFLGTGGNSVSHFGKSQDLGMILLEFFELYGRIFNYHKHGISVRGRGEYFLKQECGWAQPHAPHLLSIEDPSDPENDVGRGSFNMMQVRLAFFQAFVRLTHPDTERTLPNYKVSSLLARVIDMDPIYLTRRQRTKMIGATLRKQSNDDDKSDTSEVSDVSEQSDTSGKSDKSDKNSYTPSKSVASIMVGDKNLADLAPPIFPPSLLPTPIEIDEREVEVIDLSDDSSSEDNSSPSSHLIPMPLPANPTPAAVPTLPTSHPRPILSSSSSSFSSSSSSTPAPSSNTLSTSPNASKAYSNGISNVIVNNHSRSPNSHSHYNSNFTSNYNSNFNLNIPKQKHGKVRPANAHPNTTTTNTANTTSTNSTTNTNTSTSTTTNSNNNTKVNKKPNKKNKNRINKAKGERATGTHSNKTNFTANVAPSTATPSLSSTPSSSSPTNTPTNTNSANTASAGNSANAGNTGNAGNTSTQNNRTNNNNSGMFSPGKRRKF